MKAILKANLSFLFPYILFLTLGAIPFFISSKAETHLGFNSFHNSFLDAAFYYLTFLGDGVTALLVAVILLAVRLRYAFIVVMSYIISAIITQVLKHTLFADVVRPKKFFESIHELYLVPGVTNHIYNSFPSGHATCAFSLYLALALIVENKIYKLIFFILAFLAGYSRIYLSQHFLEDVYAGSLIGVVVTIIVFYLFQKSKVNWMDNSLASFIKKQ